jgi:hypothetical protein
LIHQKPGETTFLESLEGDVLLAPSVGVAPGQRETLGAVSPKRGRLLLTLGTAGHRWAPWDPKGLEIFVGIGSVKPIFTTGNA